MTTVCFPVQAATECTDALKLPAVRPYFTASVFLKMSKDMQGTVSIPCFHHYIVRKNAMLQTVCIASFSWYSAKAVHVFHVPAQSHLDTNTSAVTSIML